MKITRISYRQVKNLGNYETKTVEAEATLNVKDDVDEVYEDLRKFVQGKLLEDELTPDDYLE